MAPPAPLRVLLVAEESAGVQALHAIHHANFCIAAIMASPPRNGEPQKAVWSAASKLGLEVWPANLVKDPATASRIRETQVDILLNVHSLYLIHRDILGAPRLGAFNLHPGPLPRYAGLNSVSWAIYRDERQHGVTLHRMDPGIDTGPVVHQAIFPIEPDETALSLAGRCVRFGIPLVLQLLNEVSREPKNISTIEQDPQAREYFGREIPNNGSIDWSSSAKQIASFVRACDYGPFRSPWGHPRTYLGHTQIEVLKASRTGEGCHALPGTVGEAQENGVLIATADEWLLVSKLKLEGTPCRPADVLRTTQRLHNSS